MKTKDSKSILLLVIVFALSAQWIFISISHPRLDIYLLTLAAGVCVFASAFMLSWAAEMSQFYIPQSLAFIILALIAVLPEYTVDMYFAWTAGKNPAYVSYAAANMTGGNRLLVGFGWPLIILLYWLRTKKKVILFDQTQKAEIKTLLFASAYAFIIPLKRNISLIDSAVFIGIFIYYCVIALRMGIKEPELKEGPAELLGRLWSPLRLTLTIVLFLLSGYAIYVAAKPFAEGLLQIGERSGIDRFILVQWIAPLVSESPEIIIATIFTLKLMPRQGMRALISSKINQWTLLVGMLPLIYSLSSGRAAVMRLDTRQIEEILLTASQSVFALMVIWNMRFSLLEGFALFALFATQLLIPATEFRFVFSGVYIVLAALVILSRKIKWGHNTYLP